MKIIVTKSDISVVGKFFFDYIFDIGGYFLVAGIGDLFGNFDCATQLIESVLRVDNGFVKFEQDSILG